MCFLVLHLYQWQKVILSAVPQYTEMDRNVSTIVTYLAKTGYLTIVKLWLFNCAESKGATISHHYPLETTGSFKPAKALIL